MSSNIVLGNLKINNGILRIPGMSAEDINNVRDILRRGLLEYEIPHTKIIGVDVKTTRGVTTKDMATPTVLGMSYMAMSTIFNDLVFEPVGTNHLVNFTGIVNTNGSGIKMSIDQLRTKSLLKNKVIIDANNCLCIMAVARNGSGVLDFNEANASLVEAKRQLYFKEEGKSVLYKPLRVSYDLSKYFNIRPFSGGGDFIELVYSYDLNEDVLENILRNYLQEKL